MKISNKFQGCLYGGAIGDAFGFEVEFMSYADIQAKFGSDGIEEPIYHAGKLLVSDDTQMTLFTLEGLSRCMNNGTLNDTEKVIQEIYNSYLDWNLTQGSHHPSGSKPTGSLHLESCMQQQMAPGYTCMGALDSGYCGTPETPINNSKGCGGVMRVAPIGLIRSWSHSQAFDIASRAAAITHGHPSGFLSAGAMGAIINLLLNGKELHSAVSQTIGILNEHKDHKETTEALRNALHKAGEQTDNHFKMVSSLGNGWVGEEALAIGVYAALVGNSFLDAITIATNHDGDSDSTASIAGQLWGAWKGTDRKMLKLAEKLDVYGPLSTLLNTMTMKDNVCVYLGSEIGRYGFDNKHPFSKQRMNVFQDEFIRQRLDTKVCIKKPVLASKEALERFHTPEYIEKVQQQSKSGEGFLCNGASVPAFKGIFEAASFVVGSTLDAVDKIIHEGCKRAFVPIAGLHHTRADIGAGCGVFNDIVIAIETLHQIYGIRKIAYVDMDAHHGDGVFYAYEWDPDVCIVDFHQDGLYPGTGKKEETGKGSAKGSKLNIILPRGADDSLFMTYWKQAEEFLRKSEPEFIIFQCGTDSLDGDPNAHLSLTTASYTYATKRLVKLADEFCDGRILALGGGGYNLQNIADGWCAVVNSMINDKEPTVMK
jgi:acetoin utilization protein AcuC